MSRSLFISFLALVVLISISPLLASAGAPDDQFKQALSLYSEGNYKEAKTGFEKLASTYPADERFSIFRFMLSKCDYHSGDYGKAETDFVDFVNEFPGSLYLGHAHFFLGNINYLKGNKLAAAEEYIKAYDYTADEELKVLAHSSLIPLLEKGLSLGEHKTLARQSRGRKLADEVLFQLAQRQIKQKDLGQAKELLLEYVKNYPHSSHFKEAKEALDEISKSGEGFYKIGVLLPLSGEYQAYGQNLLRGIELGKEDYGPGRIELLVKDTEGSPAQTAHQAKELVEESNVVAVIGPIDNDCVVPAAVVSECFSIPLISPLAWQEGVTTLGKYIFQLSTSTKKKARAVARYASRDMGLKEFVILAPNDAYGTDAALGFQEEAVRWGGRIVSCQFYVRDSTDFTSQLGAIKRKILQEKTKAGNDTTKYLDAEGKPLPLEEIEVRVDGFFLPGYAEEVILIAPQILFAKIRTNLLGMEGWKNKKVIELCKDYVQKAVFASDSYEASDSSAFVSSYQKTYAEKPDRISALGYDSFEFLALALEAGASTSEQVGEYLSKVRDFKGASGRFDFNSNNENESYSLFTIDGKEFKKLK